MSWRPSRRRTTGDGGRTAFIPRLLSAITFALINLIGLVAYLYPFWLPVRPAGGETSGHAGDALLVFGLLVSLCLLVLLAEMTGGAVNAKVIAVLGVLTAVNTVARLADNIVQLPGGFSPIFLLIILVGYAYGARLGFLLGAFTMMVSAFLLAGVGPWLPYQMFAAGWVGLTAGGLGRLGLRGRAEIVALAVFGLIWGFLYGAITNEYFWPFVIAEGGSWEPGPGLGETLRPYAGFYLATSVWLDAMAAVGNVGRGLARGKPLSGARPAFRPPPPLESARPPGGAGESRGPKAQAVTPWAGEWVSTARRGSA